MRTGRYAGTLATLTLLALITPAGAAPGDETQPILDPVGDANFVDGASPGLLPPTGPASIPWADITKVWFSTQYETVPARRDGEVGLLKVPWGVSAHLQTAAPIAPLGPGIAYVFEWPSASCLSRIVVHVPGAGTDSRKAIFWTGSSCGNGSLTSYVLDAPRIAGNELSATLPLRIDYIGRVSDGARLRDIRAYSAPYVDYYADFTNREAVAGLIDYAPSTGALGEFQIGSDLDPRFTVAPGADPGAVTSVAPEGGFRKVMGVAYDELGRLYVADAPAPSDPDATTAGGHLWRIEPDGSIRKVAGTGKGAESPQDIGPGLEMSVGYPHGIDVGPDGRVWIADGLNRRIKVYDPATGTLRAMAGGRFGGFDGSDQPNAIPALQANLYGPRSVAVAPNGDVYWTEATFGGGCLPSRIRMLRDGVVHFIGGSRNANTGGSCGYGGDGKPVGQIKLFQPQGLAFDEEGNLLIADTENGRVRRVEAGTGIVQTVAGDGAYEHRAGTIGPLASLSKPSEIEPVPGGGFLVAEMGPSWPRLPNTAPGISYVAPNGMVSDVAGGPIAAAGPDDAPLATSFLELNAVARGPDGSIAIGDGKRLRIISPAEGGLPAPARTVVCGPLHLDPPGDANVDRNIVMATLNNASLDLRRVDVDARGSDLTATMELEDLSLEGTTPPVDDRGMPIWLYMLWDGSGPTGYVAAISPLTTDAATSPGFTFEWGEVSGYTGSTYTLLRRGAATGSADLDRDLITIAAPLSGLGLSAGERVVTHVGMTGVVQQFGIQKSIYFGDETPGWTADRSYEVGKACPEGYSP